MEILRVLWRVTLRGSKVLEDLKKLKTFNGKSFVDLPKTIQLEFLLKPLKITTLSDKSDMDVRFDLFERLNTGGIVLTNQEIRSCVYRGKFNDYIKSLTDVEDFKLTVRLTQGQEADGTREEYVLRFFAFLKNYKNFDHSVVDFLNEFMAAAAKKFDYANGEKIFKETFKQLSALPEGITRKRSTTPTNLYEGVAVGAALAILKKGKIVSKNSKWISGDELREFSTGATNSRSKVVKRIEYCRDKFLGI